MVEVRALEAIVEADRYRTASVGEEAVLQMEVDESGRQRGGNDTTGWHGTESWRCLTRS